MQSPTEFPQAGPPFQLLIHRLLERPLQWAPRQRIVYRNQRELTYVEFNQRVHRLADALTQLGVKPGHRVGVLDWDSHRYLECFFAVPMIGAILHTINVRLAPDQILYIIRHAGDQVLLVHPDYLPMLEEFGMEPMGVESIVILADDRPMPASPLQIAGEYEAFLDAASAEFPIPEFSENTVATLFYTTGTTGEPKGVFFTHRQLVLHTICSGLGLTAMRDPIGIGADDVYLPLTPMFHAHAWGVPYLATFLGLKQVYPGRYEPATIIELIRRHQVTFSHCVPTILQMLLNHPAAAEMDWSSWKVMTGGAALPRGLARQAMDRGIRIVAGYGMSETCPIASLASLKPEHANAGAEHRLDVLTRTGFPMPLMEAAIVDPAGKPLGTGVDATGELVLRGPWLTSGYYRDEKRSADLWRDGWLHTGDMAYLDEDGYIRITDRLKDVIKIGGEWISSLELESALSQHPAVAEVAVVGVADPKWDERPNACVVLRVDQRDKVTPRDLQHFLHDFIDRGCLHKRAILTQIRLMDAIPKTSVGKINKRQLREQLRQ
jgi:fatty-acyl-CoA synthase